MSARITAEFTTPAEKFHVTSWGNGWAYEVTCMETGDSFFLQDHDAEQLQAESEDFTNEVVLNQYLEALCE